MNAVTQYLKQLGYGVVDDSFYRKIDYWMQWYQGKVDFHQYRQYNGIRKIWRHRRSLGMAKKVCEDWANLELNEKVEIIIDNPTLNEAVQDVLQKNSFRVRGNQLLELSYALGTGALVEYLDNGRVMIDYIRAGMIYPLEWDNGEIVSCAFASEKTSGKKKFVYLNIHERNTEGVYIIKNQMFVRNGDALTPTDLPEGVEEEVNTHSTIPLFQIVKPNIVNNLDTESPMGISVYANAIDQMEGLDLVYDSYCNEFRLGKKRIVVPLTMSRIIQGEDGIAAPVFDDNDTEFYAMDLGQDNQDNKIQEINMELRADAHEKALKTALNLLSAKCGLGNDRFQFEKGNVKTATEVISEKSELFQNLKKHELILEKALTDMARAIAVLLGHDMDFDVTISFDDSIIEDKGAERLRDMQEIRDGLMQRWEYRVKWYGEDEATAKKMVGAEQSDNELMGFGDT